MAIILRREKGSNLTPDEADDNLEELDDRVQDLEDNPPVGVGVGNITVEGSLFYVHLTDATILGPFPMPKVKWNFRRAWQPDTAYYENDVVTRGRDGFFAVMYNHVSASTFDSEATNESDEYIYDHVLGPFSIAAPVSNITADTFVPVLGSANVYFRVANECVVTIPTNISVEFEIGTEMYFRAGSSEPVSFIPEDETVTINYREGYDSVIDGQGGVVHLKKVDTNEWDAFGAFALLVSS